MNETKNAVKSEYPMRINKYLAQKGICSRREADVLVARSLVKINGRNAKVGDKVSEGDQVDVSKKSKSIKKLQYFAFNKPRGIVTVSPVEGEKSVADIADFPEGVFTVGRLDKDSHGLIVATNDGRITDKLLNPKYDHEKEYRVRVDKKLKDRFFRIVEGGMDLEGGEITKPCKAWKIDDYTFNIILSEGKRHQIRRMCSALDYRVLDLKRVRVMSIKLGNLHAGEKREIVGEELAEFLQKLGIAIKN